MTAQPSLTVGSLCTGYGGLDLAVRTIFPTARTAWVSDIDPHVNKWLSVRHADTPNVGDFTLLNQLPPCDVLTAGFPCQPASTAGERKGIDDDRWLWPHIERTIGRMGRPPSVVLLENVPGLLTVNGGDAMADVVGGLAALGYVGSYGIVGARDVGACHRRDRLWIVAALDPGHVTGSSQHRVESQAWPIGTWEPGAVTATHSDYQLGDWTRGAWDGGGEFADGDRSDVTLLPTPVTKNNENRQSDGFGPNLGSALLPTPTVVDHGNNKTPDEWDAWTDAQRVAHGNGNGHGKSLSIETHPHRFGPYQAAVDRWASVLGRPAPEPTTDGRLNPLFVEWMMGLPEGWVTDPDLDLSRTAQLRMLGNGVVPQAGIAAYTRLLDRLTAVAA